MVSLTKFLPAADQADIEALKAQFKETRVALVAKIGENINVRRVGIDGATSLMPRRRIGVVVIGEADGNT